MNELYRILIVDDELILRNGFKYLCDWKEHGFIVVGEASNGQEALDLIPVIQPHIVIVDIVMPVMDGINFSKIMQQKYPKIKIIVLSSFSEFDYVREAFKYGASDYLLKPKLKSDDLIDLLKRVSQEIENPLSTNYEEQEASQLLGKIFGTKGDEQRIAIEELRKVMTKSSFILIKCSVAYQSSSDELITNEISRLLRSRLHSFSMIEVVDNSEYALLVNLDPHEEEGIWGDLSQLRKEHSIENIKFIVSRCFNDSRFIPRVNENVSKKLGRLLYLESEVFFSEKDIHIEEVNTSFDLSFFMKCFNGFDIEEAKAYLFNHLKLIKYYRAYDEYDFKRFIQNIIYNMLNTSQKVGFDMTELNRKKIKLFKSIDISVSYDEIILLLENFFDEISKIINTQVDKKNTIILEKVKAYVNEHYSEEITLSDIAQNLHLNYYYLSTYFKNHTSENLTTYINRVKIEKAKQLLKDSDASITEISKIVGFSDHNYFSKVFKKYVEVTPSAYRRKNVSWLKK